MKHLKLNFKNNSHGITLIALVVTVVILLILAAVSIVVLFGDNGIIKTAENAADKTNSLAHDEQDLIDNLDDFIKDQTSSSVIPPVNPTPPEITLTPSEQLGYTNSNLVLHYDGIANTRALTHNSSATTWEDLSGNNKDGTLTGCTWRR